MCLQHYFFASAHCGIMITTTWTMCHLCPYKWKTANCVGHTIQSCNPALLTVKKTPTVTKYLFALYKIWSCTLKVFTFFFKTYFVLIHLSLFCNTSCTVCHQRHKNPSLAYSFLSESLFTMYKASIPKALEASVKPLTRIWQTKQSSIDDVNWADQHPLFLVPFLTSWVMQYFNTGLIWRPKAVNCAVPTQSTTYESECLTCLHCQLLPRGNSGWWILSFLPATHQKDNSSFLRSARNSWKAPLLNHFLALPLLTAVLCHTFTGLVLWPDMSFLFCGTARKNKP